MLIALLLVEVGLRLAYGYLPFPVQNMIRHVRVWSSAGSSLGPSWLEICEGDSYLAARNLPNLKRHRVQFGPAIYHVSTTSLGFEHVGFRTMHNDSNRWDGVVVGDSFAFCHHVEMEDCWVTHVAERTGLKIANLAVPGTGSASHSRYLENYGRKLDPRYVIWQYWVNDPREDVQHVAGGLLPCMVAGTDRRGTMHNRGFLQWLKQFSISANLIKHTLVQLQKTTPDDEISTTDAYSFTTTKNRQLFAWRGEGAAIDSQVATSGFKMTTGAISLAARRSSIDKTQFLLLIAPSNLQVYADELPNDVLRTEVEAENFATDRLIEFAKDNNIDFVDLRPAFITAAARGEELYPYYDVHWTASGNKLAANAVVEWIQEKESLANARRADHRPSGRQ